MIPQVTPQQVHDKMTNGSAGEFVLLDIRDPDEWVNEGYIVGSERIMMGQIPTRLNDLPRDKEIVIYCRSGNRSQRVAMFLAQQGFDNTSNLDGGIKAWKAAGLPHEFEDASNI